MIKDKVTVDKLRADDPKAKIQDVPDPKGDQKSSAQGNEESEFLALDPRRLTPAQWLACVRRFPSIPDEKRQPQNTRNEEDIFYCPLLKLFCCKTV